MPNDAFWHPCSGCEADLLLTGGLRYATTLRLLFGIPSECEHIGGEPVFSRRLLSGLRFLGSPPVHSVLLFPAVLPTPRLRVESRNKRAARRRPYSQARTPDATSETRLLSAAICVICGFSESSRDSSCRLRVAPMDLLTCSTSGRLTRTLFGLNYALDTDIDSDFEGNACRG